jgi:hypothetical protein
VQLSHFGQRSGSLGNPRVRGSLFPDRFPGCGLPGAVEERAPLGPYLAAGSEADAMSRRTVEGVTPSRAAWPTVRWSMGVVEVAIALEVSSRRPFFLDSSRSCICSASSLRAIRVSQVVHSGRDACGGRRRARVSGVIWVAGGVLLVIVGVAVALDGWGLGGALWRFYVSSYRRWRLQPWGNELSFELGSERCLSSAGAA